VLLLRPASWLALLSRTFTFELALAGSPRASVEYDYVGKQSIPTTGLSPASPTALWAAGRVGKERPAGSNELRVSPSPSKIPYGGFSPVRLQMDRQWRPSTSSQGLSAVHIRPMTPSYTPPQLQLPGIRDPRRDYPFENLSVQCGTTPSNSHTSIQRPLARRRVMLSRRVVAYYGLIRASESLPATYGFAAESAAPKENRLEVGIQRFPNLLRWTGLACRLPYPGGPEECK
jgi:hypothetical protein